MGLPIERETMNATYDMFAEAAAAVNDTLDMGPHSALAQADVPAGSTQADGFTSTFHWLPVAFSLMKQAFGEWLSQVGDELRDYEARGHTPFELIWIVIIYIWVEFYADFYRLCKSFWKVYMNDRGKQRRRGKREKLPTIGPLGTPQREEKCITELESTTPGSVQFVAINRENLQENPITSTNSSSNRVEEQPLSPPLTFGPSNPQSPDAAGPIFCTPTTSPESNPIPAGRRYGGAEMPTFRDECSPIEIHPYDDYNANSAFIDGNQNSNNTQVERTGPFQQNVDNDPLASDYEFNDPLKNSNESSAPLVCKDSSPIQEEQEEPSLRLPCTSPITRQYLRTSFTVSHTPPNPVPLVLSNINSNRNDDSTANGDFPPPLAPFQNEQTSPPPSPSDRRALEETQEADATSEDLVPPRPMSVQNSELAPTISPSEAVSREEPEVPRKGDETSDHELMAVATAHVSNTGKTLDDTYTGDRISDNDVQIETNTDKQGHSIVDSFKQRGSVTSEQGASSLALFSSDDIQGDDTSGAETQHLASYDEFKDREVERMTLAFEDLKEDEELEDHVVVDETENSEGRQAYGSSADPSELEQVALALKAGVATVSVKAGLKKKKYSSCFSGSAAVDFLSTHLRKPRGEALQTGRQIAQKYHLFIKCGGSKKKRHRKKVQQPMVDSSRKSLMDLSKRSQMDSSGKSQFSMDASDPSAFDDSDDDDEAVSTQNLKSSLLRDHGNVYYRFYAYLPSEVKDMPLERKMNLFEAGVKLKDHRRGLKKHKNCFRGKDAVNFLVRHRLIATRYEAVKLCTRFVKEYNMFEPVNRIDNFQDSATCLYRFISRNGRYFSINNDLSTALVKYEGNDVDVWDSSQYEDDIQEGSYSISRGSDVLQNKSFLESIGEESESESEFEEEEDVHVFLSYDYHYLSEVADFLERGIKLKKQGTFAACRAVTFMVTSGLAKTRQDAEALGLRLEREFNLFHSVSGKHDFGDHNQMFRFTAKSERHYNPIRVQLPLDELAKVFEQGVKVKDYVQNLKTYKQTFVGSKAVDFLINTRLATNRAEAVRLGRLLVEQFNLFERVTGDREFSDDHVYFRFTPIDQRRAPDPEASQSQSQQQEKFEVASLLATESVTENNRDMLELAEWFLTGIKVKDHKFRAKTYPKTFPGTDAVSYMVNNSRAITRKEAVELGRQLSKDIGLFSGIDGSKDLKDDYLLYHFDDKFQNTLPENETGLRRGIVSGIEGISGVSVKSLPLVKIAEAFRSSIKGEVIKGRIRTYRDAFIGRDAVDFLVGHGLAENRVAAVDLGRTIAREFDLFEHVKREHEFKDSKHKYRFCYDGEVRPMEEIELDKLRLSEIARNFVENIKVKENRMKLLVFQDTFVGSEAVDYLMDSGVASTRKEAVQIGRAITKEFNLFEHVTNDRKFEDAYVLYHFTKNEDWYKGLLFRKQLARRNVFVDNDNSVVVVDRRHSLSSRRDTETSIDVQGLPKIDILDEDAEWASRMKLFEEKVSSAIKRPLKKINDDDDLLEAQWKHITNRFFAWVSQFHRLDPRYQIRYFFDYVAQDGATKVEDEDLTQAVNMDFLKPIINLIPNRASVFTVWRPTSLHAIRKMMCGEAVGKGLDIKGKSAKRGKTSGFVPFLQIGENKHKSKIRTPSKEGVVRVFYPGEARRARDIAAENLERVAEEMIVAVEEAKKVLASKTSVGEAQQDALTTMFLDMVDPRVLYINDYAPVRYGFEIPERLFWEAYFARQDITRIPGSEYDTGRPSQPAFQDMNFAALRAPVKPNAPRTCVYQHADPSEPMNPFELLVAYEEHGRVMPVVSDFDCFLVGTERVSFTAPLAPSQTKVLTWYVTQIENVMKESAVGDSWTVRWLEVLKKAARDGLYPEMPQFGFGDPKSYSIMRSAVAHLKNTGAVRHGAECFNYYFPQDLDDELLIIADDLPGNKPWMYVDQEGLTEILSQKIDEGYTFPLNPKWILCDAKRWYYLYKKLLKSENLNTKQAMDIWFPQGSGLREQIERIHNLRPEGFYQAPYDYEESKPSPHASPAGEPSLKSSGKNSAKGSHDYLIPMFQMDLMNHIRTVGGNTDQSVSEIAESTKVEGKKSARKFAKSKAKRSVGKLFGTSSKKARNSSHDVEDESVVMSSSRHSGGSLKVKRSSTNAASAIKLNRRSTNASSAFNVNHSSSQMSSDMDRKLLNKEIQRRSERRLSSYY